MLTGAVIKFRNKERNVKSPRQMDKNRTNEQMELHQFRKQLSCDGVLSLNLIGQSIFELESGNENIGQTGIGYINLIGGLVTRNPPKNLLNFIRFYIST